MWVPKRIRLWPPIPLGQQRHPPKARTPDPTAWAVRILLSSSSTRCPYPSTPFVLTACFEAALREGERKRHLYLHSRSSLGDSTSTTDLSQNVKRTFSTRARTLLLPTVTMGPGSLCVSVVIREVGARLDARLGFIWKGPSIRIDNHRARGS